MKAHLSIFVTALYVAFSIGLYQQVHECLKMVEASAEKEMVMDCHSKVEKKDKCCAEETAKNCCGEEEDDSACCTDSIVSFQIDEPQELSKSFMFIALPDLKQNIDTLEDEGLSQRSRDKFIFENPPPLPVDIPTQNCSLVFYG